MPVTIPPAPPAAAAPAAALAAVSRVVELRQYTLQPGRRDDLITLFEREFVETQEAAGIRVIGQFRDLDGPDRFVWLRGYPGMPSRAKALTSFYDGPVWKAHRDEANATLVDTDDVLLLHPADAESAVRLSAPGAGRPAAGSGRPAGSLIVATIYLLTSSTEADFPAFFEGSVRPLLDATGAPPLARLVTEHAENNFPRHPIRSDARAFVWLASFPSAAAYEAHRAALERSPRWKGEVEPALAARLAAPPQRLRLEPTERSLLGNVAVPPAPALEGYTRERTGDVHDFDFLEGEWTIANRRLSVRGAGSDRWEEFPATSLCRRHLGGVANADELVFPTQGWAGMTVRCFDLAKRQWSISWISSRTGTLFPPVVGGFANGRGEFYGEDEDGGRPVKVRFLWLVTGRDAARWEQAFSYDGKSWETNWEMELRRASKVSGRP